MSVKLINEGYSNTNEILIDTITVKYFQENDCTEDRGDNSKGQTLIIESRDGGGGKFLHLKTEGWSIDNETELIPIIKHFKNLCQQS